MGESFPKLLSGLRHETGVNQRTAAAALNISQALLSHYENGAREPGLGFVCRVCDYYGVTADYLLGRSESPASLEPETARDFLNSLRTLAERGEQALEKMGGRAHD